MSTLIYTCLLRPTNRPLLCSDMKLCPLTFDPFAVACRLSGPHYSVTTKDMGFVPKLYLSVWYRMLSVHYTRRTFCLGLQVFGSWNAQLWWFTTLALRKVKFSLWAWALMEEETAATHLSHPLWSFEKKKSKLTKKKENSTKYRTTQTKILLLWHVTEFN
jgi:hypothetical protein